MVTNGLTVMAMEVICFHYMHIFLKCSLTISALAPMVIMSRGLCSISPPLYFCRINVFFITEYLFYISTSVLKNLHGPLGVI